MDVTIYYRDNTSCPPIERFNLPYDHYDQSHQKIAIDCLDPSEADFVQLGIPATDQPIYFVGVFEYGDMDIQGYKASIGYFLPTRKVKNWLCKNMLLIHPAATREEYMKWLKETVSRIRVDYSDDFFERPEWLDWE